MNNLAAFYEFLDRHEIRLSAGRRPLQDDDDGTQRWSAMLMNASVKDIGAYSTLAYGPSYEEAVANLAAMIEGRVIVIMEAEIRSREEREVGTFTSAPEVAHG